MTVTASAVSSVLFATAPPEDLDRAVQPECFGDLNLDQVESALTAGREAYDLEPIIHSPLRDPDAVAFRQEVFRDLESPEVLRTVTDFARQTLVSTFRSRRDELRGERADGGHYHRARWFLNAAVGYCTAVARLADGLAAPAVHSRALRRLCDYLHAYVAGEGFSTLAAETQDLVGRLAELRYAILVRGDRVTVGHVTDEADYSKQIEATFERFRQDAPTDYRDSRPAWREEDFAGLEILDMVARLNPDPPMRLLCGSVSG